MPRPSRSILIRPRSSRSSLSHCTIVRSRIVAHSTGATRTSGSRVMTMPPEWMPMWRGKPSMRRQSRSNSAPSSPPTGAALRRPVAARAAAAALSSVDCAEARRVRRRVTARCCCRRRSRAARATEAGSRVVAPASTPERLASDSLRVVFAHERVDLVERESERFADVANRRARAVRDDLGGHRGVMPAVALVDVLDHLLAVLVREVDVDVGDLAALLATGSARRAGPRRSDRPR